LIFCSLIMTMPGRPGALQFYAREQISGNVLVLRPEKTSAIRSHARRKGARGQAPFGQFTPGAYGSGSRLYGYGSRLCGRIAEPLGLIARDCDFAALFVSEF